MQHVKALVQNELPDGRKVRLEHQIRSGFGEGRHRAEAFQERDKLLVACQGVVPEIKLKIIERLIFRRARAGEHDPHPRNAVGGNLPTHRRGLGDGAVRLHDPILDVKDPGLFPGQKKHEDRESALEVALA